ncbi:MAG: S-layer protein, partial [Candidatus ainarchaeum sp.]|nr:S-layer protein [Candidatus ainarchaeum sp.]
MKGINLKRIGAVVAGAAILASSVAFAGPLYYEDTALVTETGQPVVKVVVGAGASASDGVAAANIAAHLAKSAYKSDTYTAVAGDVTCTAAEGSTCTVTDKSVTLQVTVPGVGVAGTYVVSNLIGDYFDRTLTDRDQASAAMHEYAYGSDISEAANPFTNGTTGKLDSAPDETELYRITGSMFSPLKDYSPEDKDASKKYTEKQYLWVFGESKYDTTEKVMGADVDLLAYSIKFGSATEDLGIPVATKAATTSNFHTATSPSYETVAHKVKVMFLGEEWIISEMIPAGGNLTSQTDLVSGGSVKLAKESVFGVVNKGDSLNVGTLKFVLEDVSLGTGAKNEHPALLSVYVEGQTTPIKEGISVNPTETQDISVPGYGTYKLHVYATGPGYSFGTTWADMAIFSHELELEDDQKLDSLEGENDNWYVTLGWKNKITSTTSDDGAPDHLRTIVLHTMYTDDLLSDTLLVGDSVPIVESPVKWEMSYLGLDIDNNDRDDLRFSVIDKPLRGITLTNTSTCNLTDPYVSVTSGVTNAFEYGSATGDTFWFGNVSCDGGWVDGGVLMKIGSEYEFTTTNNSILDVMYTTAGAAGTYADGGVVRVYEDDTYGANFTVVEEAGKDISAGLVDMMTFIFNMTDTKFIGSLDDEDDITYVVAGPVINNNTVEDGYTSERGSVFVSLTDTRVSFKIAKQLANSQLFFSSSGSDVEPDTAILSNMVEGEERT